MRDRLIELLAYFVDGYAVGNRHMCENTRVTEIADYLLANGVIVPPCMVGDTVYYISSTRVKEAVIDEIYIGKDNRMEFSLVFDCDKDCGSCPFVEWDCNSECGNTIWNAKYFGKTVFLTREEAEAALKGGVQE